jgi:hypothetical protein
LRRIPANPITRAALIKEATMLSRISDLFHAWAKGWLILALAAVFVVYIAVTFPALQAAPGGDIESLDAQMFYTPEEAYATIGSYGEARGSWVWIYLTWDIINPILYTLIFGLLISWLIQRGFKPESRMQKLNLLPLGGGVSDLLENISIIMMLLAYPAQLTIVAWLSTVFTIGKMGFLLASVLLVLLGIVRTAMNGFRKQ